MKHGTLAHPRLTLTYSQLMEFSLKGYIKQGYYVVQKLVGASTKLVYKGAGSHVRAGCAPLCDHLPSHPQPPRTIITTTTTTTGRPALPPLLLHDHLGPAAPRVRRQEARPLALRLRLPGP